MSFCFLYNVVSENHSVQNSPRGGGGSIASSRSMAADICMDFNSEEEQTQFHHSYSFQTTVMVVLHLIKGQ